MNRFLSLLFLIALLGTMPVMAVTPKEMDQARAIAAQAYLRYANDGSGYLDNVKPSSMADLEKVLKTKEVANLKDFKAIPVPNDYAKWSKADLVEYWSTTAFSNSALSAKGKAGKARARKNLNAMKVADPTPANDNKAPEKTTTNGKSTQETNITADTKTVKEEKATPTDNPLSTENKTEAKSILPNDSLTIEAENKLSMEEQMLTNEPEEEPIEKSTNTWVYVVILCILVGVVVALVVFASNVIKKNASTQRPKAEEAIPAISGNADVSAIREKFAATLNSKNLEIQSLNKKIEALTGDNENLKFKLERLNSEVELLRKRSQTVPQTQPTPSVQNATVAVPASNASAQQPRQKSVRSLFLAHANSKGLFVRADRQIVPDSTVFRLDSTDGYSGSFRVVNDPTVWANCLAMPVKKLSNACVVADYNVVPGMQRVVTDTSGTAVLEDGHWKVLRKAKVHFE